MVQPIEPGNGSARTSQQAATQLRYDTRKRADQLAAKLLDLDRQWHARVDYLQKRGSEQYHIDHDIILRNLSGATKVVSDMLAAMSAYLVATAPPNASWRDPR